MRPVMRPVMRARGTVRPKFNQLVVSVNFQAGKICCPDDEAVGNGFRKSGWLLALTLSRLLN